MSFDLCVFFTTRKHTDSEALARYLAYCEQSDLESIIEPSPAIAAFLEELTSKCPQIDDWPEETIDDCPWSAAFDKSDGHLIMPMRSSVAGRLPAQIVSLAAKHGLVCVDPQSSKVVAAPWAPPPKRPWWRFWR